MTSRQALALVRNAFCRETWEAVDQMDFICRLHGIVDHRWLGRRLVDPPWGDRGMLPENRGPVYFEVSDVHRPADRVAFHGYEQPGYAVGHTGGIGRVDFA